MRRPLFGPQKFLEGSFVLTAAMLANSVGCCGARSISHYDVAYPQTEAAKRSEK
jgi:hypothetical protein